jgi:hypothetical protein
MPPHLNQERSDVSLTDLAKLYPELWQEVMGSIKLAVEKKQMSELATMSQRAGATISRWSGAGDSPIAQTQHAKRELLKAQMTALAIEQFVTAFTNLGHKPSLRDQVLLKWGITRHLQAGRLLSLTSFQKGWSRLTDKGAAASGVQSAGFWSIPTRELCLGLKEYIKDLEVLEVGAGRGLFVSALREVGVRVTGIDDCSWSMAKNVIAGAKPFMNVESAETALKTINPSVVLSVYPPPGNQFERTIFATKSVDLYLAVVSSHQFASGNWQDYKAQDARNSQFSCVMNESLNKMLRPIESDQRLLIFRRKK